MLLHTETVGDGPRTAALVHGVSGSTLAWHGFATLLVERFDLRVVLVDLRGHGRSGRSDRYRTADFAADLVETLPVGIDLLIGHSLGGRAGAIAAAEVRPGRFIGLDPALWATRPAIFALRHLLPHVPRLPDGVLRRIGMPPAGAPAGTLERARQSWERWDRTMMRELVTDAQADPWLLQPPAVPSTLLLAEASWVVSPVQANQLRSRGWDVRVLDGVDHDFPTLHPDRAIDALADVLAPANPR